MQLKTNNQKGFTLIEVLVVIALTVVVMGLIFGPLVQSSKFTHNAQVMIRTQESARFALAEVSRDLSSAMFVYDTSSPVSFPMVDKSGNFKSVPVKYAKLDMILPRMLGYCTADQAKHGDHTRVFNRNYTYKKADGTIVEDPNLVEASPVCPHDQTRLELRPVQPLTADTKVVRYFIALRDPSVVDASDNPRYVNPYSDHAKTPITVNGREVDKNMYVLYRAEFSPSDDNAGGNLLFPTGRSALANLNDPDFFYRQGNNSSGEKYREAWKKISRIVASPDDMDLITATWDDNTGQPMVVPTIQFTPTAISDEVLQPAVAAGAMPEHSGFIPYVFKSTYGNWVRTATLDSSDNTYREPYTISVYRPHDPTVLDGTGTPVVYTTGTDKDTGLRWIYKNSSTKIFNITRYEDTSASSSYGAGTVETGDSNVHQPELAFTIDDTKGTVNFAFPCVDSTVSSGLSNVMGGGAAASVKVDTYDINYCFSHQSPTDAHRMWVVNNPSNYTLGSTTISKKSSSMGLAYSSVIPGLEKVFGPNANPGQSYGVPIQYTRVPFLDMFTEPGANQYKLDFQYTVPNASGNMVADGTAGLYFHSDPSGRLPQLDPGHPTDALYSDLIDKPGTISSIYVLYYEQNNKNDDVIKASYVTKSVITINLGMKIFDSANGKPFVVQLSNKIKVKNSAS